MAKNSYVINTIFFLAVAKCKSNRLLYSGVYYHANGACNGEFGGIAACNHSLIAQNLSFDGKKPD